MPEHEIDDGLMLFYNLFKDDELIKKYCTSERDGLKVRFFEYPETADMSGNWIVLESIINELPSNFADNKWLTYDYLLHVEVWSRDRSKNRMLASHIRNIVNGAYGFTQDDDIDEYDLGIYRDARRYKGTLYRSDLENI